MSMGITDRNVAKALCLSPGSHELLSQLRDEDIAKVYLINEELDAAMEEQVMLSAKFEVARDGTEQAMAGWDESREQLRRARAAEAIARSAWQNQVKKERTLQTNEQQAAERVRELTAEYEKMAALEHRWEEISRKLNIPRNEKLAGRITKKRNKTIRQPVTEAGKKQAAITAMNKLPKFSRIARAYSEDAEESIKAPFNVHKPVVASKGNQGRAISPKVALQDGQARGRTQATTQHGESDSRQKKVKNEAGTDSSNSK